MVQMPNRATVCMRKRLLELSPHLKLSLAWGKNTMNQKPILDLPQWQKDAKVRNTVILLKRRPWPKIQLNCSDMALMMIDIQK